MRDLIPGHRAVPVWRRNAAIYGRVWFSNLVGHLADPLFYLAVLGFGLGSLMPQVGGMPYISFLFAGVVAGAAMSSACFESSYGSFHRMRNQGTFDAILATPVRVADLAGGEITWGATKGVISAVATLVVGIGFGIFPAGWWLLPAVLAVAVQGLFFGGVSLAVAAWIRGFEGLNHFYALFMMPVLFLSGVFFPLDEMPAPLRVVAAFNPLTHTVHLIRPLSAGSVPEGWPLEVLWLLLAALFGTVLGSIGLRRRMIV